MTTTTQNSTTFIPKLFDGRFHGVYSFKTVLEYHKEVENFMPQDGIVWLCENPVMKTLFERRDKLREKINELVKYQDGLPYSCWTLLDREAHMLRTRIQLITLCLEEKFL